MNFYICNNADHLIDGFIMSKRRHSITTVMKKVFCRFQARHSRF